MRAYANCRIFTGSEIISGFSVITDEGSVRCICRDDEVTCDSLDLGGRILSSGFIDMQVNGGGGVLFNEQPTSEGLRRIYEAHRAFGTASICPTFITGDRADLTEAAKAVSRADIRCIPALHIEGFFISPEKCGIHDMDCALTPTVENVRMLYDQPCKMIVTIAPEVFGDELRSCMREMKSCIVFGGHTNCTDSIFAEFLKAGGIGATHLFNAMSGMSARNPGAVGAVFDSQSAYAGIIPDGHHVSYTSVRVAKRIMGERLFIVSDAMPPACSDITEYELYGRTIHVKDGVCVSDSGTIAGSCLCMMQAVKNCVENCGIPLTEALRMATVYPATVLCRDDLCGIHEGSAAIFTVFDDGLSHAQVIE